ncbi:MAG: PA2778 family cysteine peptidase [Pseudomonadota bacterium]
MPGRLPATTLPTAASWLLFMWLLTGCAAHPERHLLRTAGPAVELAHVPFFAQEDFQCGPAALATVLRADRVDVTPEQLVPQVYVPERRGSLQAELIAAARRHGRVPYVLPPSLAPVLGELRAGRPVLVLQNSGLQSLPAWHYAVLVGFDPERETFLLRSGTTARLQIRADRFLAGWDRAGRWAMVVVAPSELPVSAEPARWLQAVAPFEATGHPETAATGYETALARWPQETAAWTALGNARHRQQRHDDAERAWHTALALPAGPQDAAHWTARNNLAGLLAERQCRRHAQRLIDEAGMPPPGMAAAWAETVAAVAAAGDSGCP